MPSDQDNFKIYLEGAPSQMDLFDPKPKLNELNGQTLPESLTKNVRFAFIKKETASVHGQQAQVHEARRNAAWSFAICCRTSATCADDMLMVRSMHTDQFNHHPAQLMMHCGRADCSVGRRMGAWLNYGLGSESKNLPGYVVLTAGRGTSGGASLWSSGFLPSSYAGVLFRNQGEPVLEPEQSAGITDRDAAAGLDAIPRSEPPRYERVRDPEIASRIAGIRAGVPHADGRAGIDRPSGESQATLDRLRRATAKTRPIEERTRGGGPGPSLQRFAHELPAGPATDRARCALRATSMHASWDHHSESRARSSRSTAAWPTSRSRRC